MAPRPVIEDRVMLVSSLAPKLPAKLELAACRDMPFVLISGATLPRDTLVKWIANGNGT